MHDVKLLLQFYFVSLVINFIISFVQWFFHKVQLQKKVFLYWASCFVAAITNLTMNEMQIKGLPPILLIASTASFISTYILAQFLAEVVGYQIQKMKLFIAYFILLTISILLSLSKFHFYFYSTIILIGVNIPIIVSAYYCYGKYKKQLTSIQKLFMSTLVLLGFHYLDWPWFRLRPELYFWGLALAFILFHILTILMPMMANDKALIDRSSALEKDIENKVTELTNTKEQLWNANKMATIGRLAGGVAHEVNNPLQIISIRMHLLKELAQTNQLTPESVIETASKVQSVVERISTITRSLLKVSKDQKILDKKTYNLIKLFNSSIDLNRDIVTSAGISLNIQIPSFPIYSYCNEAEISQIIMNLINNAVDALLEQVDNTDKTINIAVYQKNNLCEFTVENAGLIPLDIQDQIMEPFFTTKDIGKGTGLGLSISKSIAENHNGRLYLDKLSTNTRFVLELPIQTHLRQEQKLNHEKSNGC